MKQVLLYRWFAQRISKKWFFSLFLILVGWNIILGVLSAKIIGDKGATVKILDLENGYTPTQVYAWWAAYGENGLWWYSFINCFIDILYPITYTLFFTLVLVTLLEYSVPKWVNNLYQLTLVPFIIFAADMVENGLVFIALRQYPSPSDMILQIASVATQIKWLFIVFWLALAIIGLVTYFANGKEARKSLNNYKNV